ncbi:MAG: DUF108 domain-containing protein [Candidatus Omnitrophica bacterium]|nr:DUF108 domain-containing protein [Candidatus Omnitrophota bacterium]
MKKLRIGIIGCGTIGSALARAVERRFSKHAHLAYIAELDRPKADRLIHSLKAKPLLLSIAQLVKRSDFIIEAASAKISGGIAHSALKRNKEILVMSVGGLLASFSSLERILKCTKGTLYIPSGAVAGIDAVLASREGKIRSATLITRKPPAGLRGAPFFKTSKIKLERVRKETLIFEGNVIQAVKAFPKNVNVSALLALAGIGPRKTKVRLYTSPKYTKNSHEIIVEGDCGVVHTRTDNMPSKENPKTSALAIRSAEALLTKVFSRFKVGT